MIAGMRTLAVFTALASSGALLWIGAAPDETTVLGYAAQVAAVAGAGTALGLALVVAARIGTTTAAPRAGLLAGAALALVLAVLAGLWIVAAHAPGGEIASDIRRWSADAGVLAPVDDLRPTAVAFAVGVLAAALLALVVPDRSAPSASAARGLPAGEGAFVERHPAA